MMRFIQWAFLGALAAAVLLAPMYVNSGGFDSRDKWVGGDSLMTVAGDSVTYYITNHILPGGRDTTDAYDTRECDAIQLALFGSGDSLAYWVQYSIDKTNWFSVYDSTFVNAAESADYPPTTASWNTCLIRQFTHNAGTVTNFGYFMYPWLRVCFINADLSDTLINARVRVMCGK